MIIPTMSTATTTATTTAMVVTIIVYKPDATRQRHSYQKQYCQSDQK